MEQNNEFTDRALKTIQEFLNELPRQRVRIVCTSSTPVNSLQLDSLSVQELLGQLEDDLDLDRSGDAINPLDLRLKNTTVGEVIRMVWERRRR